jgi:hypothetical protein
MRKGTPLERRDQQLREAVDLFAILLATIRALLLNKSAKIPVLGTYDSMGEQLIRLLRDSGLSPEELMALERHLAHLRAALDQETE